MISDLKALMTNSIFTIAAAVFLISALSTPAEGGGLDGSKPPCEAGPDAVIEESPKEFVVLRSDAVSDKWAPWEKARQNYIKLWKPLARSLANPDIHSLILVAHSGAKGNGGRPYRRILPGLGDPAWFIDLEQQKKKEGERVFKITEQSLDNLKSEHVPDDVWKELKGIKDRKVVGEAKFIAILVFADFLSDCEIRRRLISQVCEVIALSEEDSESIGLPIEFATHLRAISERINDVLRAMQGGNRSGSKGFSRGVERIHYRRSLRKVDSGSFSSR